jgi:hypothetical protein
MTNEPCINWPCAKGAGHAGPCGTSRDEQPVQPSSNELLSQAWDDIDSLMEYAFDNGFHELGYDPARVISDEMERVAQELADLKAAGSSAPEPSVVLWAMHIPGPDDVWACASKEAAEKRAKEHNDAIRKVGLAAQFGMQEESVLARVIEWPHSAESHAESLRDDVADTLFEPVR